MRFFQIAALSLFLFCFPLHAQLCPRYISHHVVGTRAIVPGVYFLRQALQIAQREAGSEEPVGVSSFLIRKPMVYGPDAQLDCSLGARGRVLCVDAKNGEVHARGKIQTNPTVPDLGEVPAEFYSYIPAPEVYGFLSDRGLLYGNYFRGLVGAVELLRNYVAASVKAHSEFRSEVPAADPLHPTVLDSALHAIAAFAMRDERGLRSREVAVPVLFEEVYWNPSAASQGRYSVIIRRDPTENADKQIFFDLILRNESQQVVFAIERGVLQVIPANLLDEY